MLVNNKEAAQKQQTRLLIFYSAFKLKLLISFAQVIYLRNACSQFPNCFANTTNEPLMHSSCPKSYVLTSQTYVYVCTGV